MRKRMALDVRAGVGHLPDLLPRKGVDRLPDDFGIDEDGEREMFPLELRKRLGVRASPAVIDRDGDGILRQRWPLPGYVLIDFLQRNDGVPGHRQIAHLLTEDVAADLHPGVLRRLNDVIAEDGGACRVEVGCWTARE